MRVDRHSNRALTQPMNSFKQLGYAIAVIVVATLSGCSTPKDAPFYAEVPDASPQPVSSAKAPPQADQPRNEQSVSPVIETQSVTAEKPELIVTPDDTLTGTVVSVNSVGRFVVLRFPLGRMPAVGSTLFVYRQGLKVAELKVTGPQKDDHTIADIHNGECRVEDEVRNR